MGSHELDWSGSGQGQVAGACECRNEPSVSIKSGEFLEWLRTFWFHTNYSVPWSK